jgi:methionyl-tRNA formyltransferase
MRIAFMGTPDFAVPTLDALLDAGHDVAAVYTQPPRPAGRGKALLPSPVQKRAEAAGLAVRTPASLRSAEEQQAFAALDLEAAVVAAYGLILPEPVLQAPEYGCLNVHASLLPRWRGAAPIQRAILAGDTRTGVTIMQMEKGLDTGPMMAVLPAEIDRKTAGELTAELAALGARLMVQVLDRLPGQVGRIPQNDARATYAPKIGKSEAKLDFTKSAVEVERQVRAFNPAPGAWFEFGGERIRVLAAEVGERNGAPGTVLDDSLTIACAEGALAPSLVQRAGRGAMTTAALLRGFAIPAGATLT